MINRREEAEYPKGGFGSDEDRKVSNGESRKGERIQGLYRTGRSTERRRKRVSRYLLGTKTKGVTREKSVGETKLGEIVELLPARSEWGLTGREKNRGRRRLSYWFKV